MVLSKTSMVGDREPPGPRMHHRGQPRSYDAGMSRPSRPAPRTYSDRWPDSTCTDEVAEVARLLALRLKAITDRRGIREVARGDTGISHSIISRVVNGEAWADTATLARLELALETDLWPRRQHRDTERSHER